MLKINHTPIKHTLRMLRKGKYLAFKCFPEHEFSDRVHVSNHWVLVQALAYTPVPNYDML